ncbi:hypothetical protein [Nocardioides sp. LHG3406-4]|uniref:hypothetical protein n=1 Tax=Nocardioides sp. LHG3406-4 TaxID=2804575 RepID=UPI003CF49A3E
MIRLATTAMATLALLALAAPAGADTGSIVDSDEALRPNTDIKKVKINNGETSVGLRVKFYELDPEKRARVRVLIDPAPKDTTQYIVESVKRPGQDGETWLLLAVGMEFDGTPIECDGIEGAWDYDRALVTMQVPQSCLPENGVMHKYKATTIYGDRSGDWTEFARVRKG